MDERLPIHALKDRLEAERLRAIEGLAKDSLEIGSWPDKLKWIALLQNTLTAVREELAIHSSKVGWGSEEPLN